MFFYIFIGVGLSALIFCFLYFSLWREKVRIDEEKQLIQQEKQIVVEFMHNMVEAIGEGTDRNELFQRVVHAAVLSTGALSACVMETNEKNKRLSTVAMEGLFPPQHPFSEALQSQFKTRAKFIEHVLKSETLEWGEGLLGSVAKSRKAVFIKNALGDPRLVHHHDVSLHISSIIVAPIIFGEKVIGVLAVVNPADGNNFTETDFSLIQSLAEHSALAIHNVDVMTLWVEKNKMDLDLSLARGVQGLLFPKKFPQLSYLDIDARYNPAQQVGGDLYNVIEISKNKVGVAIADVTGKGIPASLVMAICQTHLVHFARQFRSPAKVLSAMNRELLNTLRRDMFITMIYAVIDSERNEITFARAGHELPLLLLKNQDTGEFDPTMLESEGMGLGMVPPDIFDPIIMDKTVPFNVQDMLVLYTDGVTEATNEKGIAFSNMRLVDTVRSLYECSAKEVNQKILNQVADFASRGSWVDDMTLVTVKHREAIRSS